LSSHIYIISSQKRLLHIVANNNPAAILCTVLSNLSSRICVHLQKKCERKPSLLMTNKQDHSVTAEVDRSLGRPY